MEEGKTAEEPVVESGGAEANEKAEVEEKTAEEKPEEGEQAPEDKPPEEIENTKDETSEQKSPEDKPNEPPPEEETYDAEPEEVIEESEESIEECPSIESLDSGDEELARICSPILKQNYKDYLVLMKEIKSQNKAIQNIKVDIQSICCRSKRSQCDKREIKALRLCLSEENEKLTCLMRKAIELQSHDPSRRFKNINLETSLEEDMMVVEANNTEQEQNLSEQKDMERLQKALDKMQRSIETMVVKIKELKDGEERNI